MSAAFTVARKELRALFQSPIAILFMSVFLVLTLFLFFTQARYFARNLADVRPLFSWLPILLIFLVSAITMRSWAEERKAGTLEVLLTLPVRTSDLVLGKFFAGLSLVALALACTIPLPLTIAYYGPLDWGPVIGGYFAAMLLAGAYLAIGLCISARTDNQVVALMVTLVLGGVLYLVGTDLITTFLTTSNASVARAIGTGARFESIERGVLDLRDIVYYTSLTTVFLVINGVFLEWERLDTGSTHGRVRSTALVGLVALVGANAVALNLWLGPVHAARVDLTADNDYTISRVTKNLLDNLDEPVHLRGFFSEKTHPLLAPLVPQIEDLLAEYEIYGDGKVNVEISDPNADETLEAEIHELYAIEAVPFGVADRHSQGVVNAFFHLVVVYGDTFEVLDFQDLVEVRSDAVGMNVKIKNLEYDLTRAIKKVSQDFETLESIIAKLPAQAQITAYISPGSIPEDFKASADALRMVGKEMAAINPQKVVFAEVDPTNDAKLQQQLLDNFGIQALSADLFATQRFYLHALVVVGNHVERIMPRGQLGAPEIRKAIDSALSRAVPGQLKTVALATEKPRQQPNPELPPNMQLPPEDPDYRVFEQLIQQNYKVERVELSDGFVPEQVDTLLIGKIGAMTPRQLFAVDQFLMRGGSVIAMAGRHRIKADNKGLGAVAEGQGLFQLLETYGVKVEDTLVMSDDNAPFPLPVQKRLGPDGPVVQQLELLAYPFFPDLRGKVLAQHAGLSGINSVTMPWSSPLTLTAETLEDREVTWLVRSGEDATLRAGGRIEPDSVSQGSALWTPTGEPGQVTLGYAIVGKFPSFFADKPNPMLAGAGGEAVDTSGRTLKASVAPGRLVVLGSSELTSDLMIRLASSIQSEQHAGNVQLVQNLLDWTLEDTDMLSIRTGGAFARTLPPLEPMEANVIEIRTWLLVLLPIVGVVLFPWLRRRRITAIPLTTITA